MKYEYDYELRNKIQPLVDMFCLFTGANPKHVDLPTRKREVVLVRQMVSYYLELHTKFSEATLGAIFNKDHATHRNSVKTISDLIETNIKFNDYDKENSNKIIELIDRIFYPGKFQSEESKREAAEIAIWHGCY